ncbi:HTH-type transcriptional repressor KstR2 [Roseivivax sp. THAF40]|uniref:TetR/AcrR family transcriptional regulator n=1 Tax=unclassified Roseivivax TaxID=2639302 RepID=UPI001267B0EC|nr:MULTISPECIES: TetR/AcrR family transcriptional regulator [unclassified Roseivivax]QFS83509.1 HTH-type transcriptional repressor KstR2 [Roseivivax sp. THAF197b]QFT47254.1 HTH-type transcriptional repressor KstR2 [Roseivivax sp. THAF40]
MARPRAQDFEEKRHGLLLDAARVFAEQGMEKASMAEIARAAGVSKSLLYHYYPSKSELIFAIIHDHLAALDAALEAATDPDEPPEARLETLVATMLEAYRGADNQHKVQINADPALSDAQRAALRAIERRIVGRFAALLSEVAPSLSEGGAPRLTAVTMSLLGMLNWAYLWFRDDGALSRRDYAKIATELMLGGVPRLT